MRNSRDLELSYLWRSRAALWWLLRYHPPSGEVVGGRWSQRGGLLAPNPPPDRIFSSQALSGVSSHPSTTSSTIQPKTSEAGIKPNDEGPNYGDSRTEKSQIWVVDKLMWVGLRQTWDQTPWFKRHMQYTVRLTQRDLISSAGEVILQIKGRPMKNIPPYERIF